MSKSFRNKHAYGAVVGGFNYEVKTDDSNIADMLNRIKNRFEAYCERSINRLINKDTTELNQKNALKAAAAKWFFAWMFMTFRVKTFIKTLSANPNGNRTGKELYAEYLRNDCKISAFKPKLYDQERLLIFDEALKDGQIVGGLSYWRIFQHTFSLLGAIQSDLGDIAIHVSNPEKITEEYVVKIANAMHKQKQQEAEATTETDTEDTDDPIVQEVNSENIGEMTVEQILEHVQTNELDIAEIDDVETLQALYPELTAGLKGAVTRRINALVA